MRIVQITDKFARRIPCRGTYMKATYDNGVMTLAHSYSSNPIAEILDYKDSSNFRLRIHMNRERCGRTSHMNRVDYVLHSVQMLKDAKDWENLRYTAYIRYQIRVYDKHLSNEYTLLEHPLEFILNDGHLTLDYQVLESHAFPDAPVPAPAELDENSNLQALDYKLSAILAGV